MRYLVTWSEETLNKVTVKANSHGEALQKVKNFDFEEAPIVETYTILEDSYRVLELPDKRQLSLFTEDLIDRQQHK